MRHLSVCLALCASLMLGPILAAEPDEQNFLKLKTGEAFDAQCNLFKQFERNFFSILEIDYRAETAIYADWQSGMVDEVAYQTHLDGLIAEANAIADEIGCRPPAAPHVDWLRSQIVPLLYTDLVIAFDTGGLSDEEKAAGLTYENMMASHYGENWPPAAEYFQADAARQLREAQEQDSAFDVLPDFSFLNDTEFDFAESALRSKAARTLNSILFEIAVERQDLHLRPGFGARSGIVEMQGAYNIAVADIWRSGETFALLEDGTRIHAALTVLPFGSIRVMVFGPEAERLAGGGVSYLLPEGPLPEGFSSETEFYADPAWRQSAARFEATLIDDPCLGGPCFELPYDTMSAIMRAGEGRLAQLVFRENLSTPLPPPGEPNAALTPIRPTALFHRAEIPAALD